MDYTRMKLSFKYFNHCDASYEEIDDKIGLKFDNKKEYLEAYNSKWR